MATHHAPSDVAIKDEHIKFDQVLLSSDATLKALESINTTKYGPVSVTYFPFNFQMPNIHIEKWPHNATVELHSVTYNTFSIVTSGELAVEYNTKEGTFKVFNMKTNDWIFIPRGVTHKCTAIGECTAVYLSETH